MKNRTFLIFLLFLSAGICAEQRVITDEDILRVHSQINHSEIPCLIAPCIPLSTNNFDPFVELSDARAKAKKRTKRTYTATMSEIVITDISAALQDAEVNSSKNYENQRPDYTNCKHGHHNIRIVMYLNDGSIYNGTGNYDCTYTGYKVDRKQRGRNGSSIPDPYAPWYLEHKVTQHISIASFAKSAGISNEEMVKRILYYGIRAFIIDGNITKDITEYTPIERVANISNNYNGQQLNNNQIGFRDNGISSALFHAAGYESKMPAYREKEYAAGMAEWKQASEEMAKEDADITKASQLYISASEHLWYAKQLNYDLVEEIDSIFTNRYIIPLYNDGKGDIMALQTPFQTYHNTMRSIKTPNSDAPHKFRSNVTLADKSAVCLIWMLKIGSIDYSPMYFVAYNELNSAEHMTETVRKILANHDEQFLKTLNNKAETDPKFVILAYTNFMKNPIQNPWGYSKIVFEACFYERVYRAAINYSSKEYNRMFFEYYNKYYDKRNEANYHKDYLTEQNALFYKTLENQAKSSPGFIIRACTHYLNNPMKDDGDREKNLIKNYLYNAQLAVHKNHSSLYNPNEFIEKLYKEASVDPNHAITFIDTYIRNTPYAEDIINDLIVLRPKCANIQNQRNMRNNQFDLLSMLRYKENTRMWNLSKEYNGKYIGEVFHDYYDELNRGLSYSLDTLCTMIIKGESNKVLDIYHAQLDSIVGFSADEYFEQNDILNYINLYYVFVKAAQDIKQYAINRDISSAAKMKKLLEKKMLNVSELGKSMDFHVGVRASIGDSAKSAKLISIRRQWSDIRKQIDFCKQAVNYDEGKDFLVVVRSSDISGINLELCFDDKAIPVSDVYMNGQRLDIQPMIDKSSYKNRLIYTSKEAIKSKEGTDVYCIVFKSQKGINNLALKPVILNGSSDYLVLEYPKSYSKGSVPKNIGFYVIAH